ncbi:Protein CBG11150 [Caenorhabditis briggsae]|uniref:non-specific serine/threonine protein kinase n=1 Tax=Caenorhabditis briggsae TaxID=6238 RepID=A8XCK4_CAEBR|nr:Protein CBG11150 [Caenorhabditis briggsae]CAP30353.2 Protein CBG11150 [Caenorhabditis briggsae]
MSVLEGGIIVPEMKKYTPPLKDQNGSELLQMNEMFRGRFQVRGLIGRGGYGQIYYASDPVFPDDVVIKIEPVVRRGSTSKRMLLEQKILYRLQGRPHVPIMCASGHTDQLNFIVMQLLGPNIGDLKKRSPVKRLSPSTVARIIIQGIAALRDVHSLGYLHRDVKPANMCFGITQNTRHVLKLVDYGLVRRFMNPDGTRRKLRNRPGFRGTLRYVSVRVHDRKDQSPADDFVSMAYSGVELLLVNLPWKLTHIEDLRNAKEEFQQPNSPFLQLTGPAYTIFCAAVFSLRSSDQPDYSALQALLFDMMGDKSMKDAYDWEENYRDAYGSAVLGSSSENKDI